MQLCVIAHSSLSSNVRVSNVQVDCKHIRNVELGFLTELPAAPETWQIILPK